MTAPVLDRDTRRLEVDRRHLASLLDLRNGAAVDQSDVLHRQLVDGGLVVDGAVVPAAARVVDTVVAASARVHLRRWRGGVDLPVVELFAGPAGLVALPGGLGPEARHSVLSYPRPTAIARLIARLVALPLGGTTPPLEPGSYSWESLIALALDPESGIDMLDLRWGDPTDEVLGSVLVLLWHRDGGIMQIVEGDEPGSMLLHESEPFAVWTQLTVLTTHHARGIDRPGPDGADE